MSTGRGVTVARLVWDHVVRVRISAPRHLSGCRIMAIMTAFQAVDVGSIPITRSFKTPFKKGALIYLAYSIIRLSRITLTLISPGYLSSS